MIHISPQKTPNTFICELCDFSTCNKKDYNRHLDTAKHKKIHNDTLLAPTADNLYECECGNTYKQRNNLYRHRKKCKDMGKINNKNLDPNSNANVIISKEEYIAYLSNTEFIKKLFEQNMELQSTIVEMSKQSGTQNNNTNSNNINNIHTTNSNNKTAFNLNVYLNETCKDAMNLSEFVDTVIPTLEELEHTGREGHPDGVSKIISTRLRELEKELRPIHCSDGKREIFYIKENNIWNKEADEKPLLIGAIKQIAQKNIKNILKWRDEHPGCTQSDSNKNDLYLRIVMNAMMGGSQEETEKNIEKIIRNITKYTLIDKVI
jgi:hypothetical protein